MAKTYTYSNEGITSRNGKDLIKIPISLAGEISTETRHVFLAILNRVQFKVNNDSIQGNRLADAIDEAEGKDTIEIGEGVYDWLIEKLKDVDREGYQVCPFIFRVNGSIVYEFIKDGFNKPHQPAEKKKGKEGEDASLKEGE